MAHKVVYKKEGGCFELNKPMIDWFWSNGSQEMRSFLELCLEEGELMGTEDIYEFISNGLIWDFKTYGLERHEPELVKCVEELGEDISGLSIHTIVGNRYRIEEIEDIGREYVLEPSDEIYVTIND